MGTPEFAVASLKELILSDHEVVGVVTVADKPSGRGQKMKASPVKIAAQEYDIPVLQPVKLKDPEFIEELRSLNADLFVVVAFRMLPEIVWAMPKLGTFNLHASLLPQYRGAAPINWAIINGETETGVTTFFINHQIDTGHILLQERISIEDQMNAGDLHDKMMIEGGKLTAKTAKEIFSQNMESKPQIIDLDRVLQSAPKIFKADCEVDWNNSADQIFNKIRGLSPYPAAWTTLETTEGRLIKTKIFEASNQAELTLPIGEIKISEKRIFIGTTTTAIEIKQIQPEGKKRMETNIFLLGFRENLKKVF